MYTIYIIIVIVPNYTIFFIFFFFDFDNMIINFCIICNFIRFLFLLLYVFFFNNYKYY
nr:MAG TPA: hypothetical protein [Caudoviricetes sp.]